MQKFHTIQMNFSSLPTLDSYWFILSSVFGDSESRSLKRLKRTRYPVCAWNGIGYSFTRIIYNHFFTPQNSPLSCLKHVNEKSCVLFALLCSYHNPTHFLFVYIPVWWKAGRHATYWGQQARQRRYDFIHPNQQHETCHSI